MKKLVYSSTLLDDLYDYEGWDPADIDLYNSIDWKQRNYKEYPVPTDSFMGTARLYSQQGEITQRVKFIKYIRPNAIFAPYYRPEVEKPFDVDFSYVGPMYDGAVHGYYGVHDRFESSQLYDILSR